MMDDALTKDGIKYMIARLVENASEAAKESRADKSDMLAAGRRLAYYEISGIDGVLHHILYIISQLIPILIPHAILLKSKIENK